MKSCPAQVEMMLALNQATGVIVSCFLPKEHAGKHSATLFHVEADHGPRKDASATNHCIGRVEWDDEISRRHA